MDNIDDYLQNERDITIDNQDIAQGSMDITPNEQGKIAMKKVVTTFNVNDYYDDYIETKNELESIENNTISEYKFSGIVNVHNNENFSLGNISEDKWANSETNFIVNVNVPAPIISTAIEQPGYYKFNNNWNALVSGTSSDYNLYVNISPVTPNLIYRSFSSNGLYNASEFNADGFSSVLVAVSPPVISNSIENNGYYKFNQYWNGLISGTDQDYNINVNVKPYLPNNLHQTLNYVGYWKWDAINNLFVRGNGIDSTNYDILIEPIWYDGENGQKKRIRINNGIVYDVNMVDTDFNGGQEVNVFQNTPQVQMLQRSLKNETKSRDINSMFNSFEIEGIPPTIASAITTNGYYKFNENWNGLITGTEQDHELEVDVLNEPQWNGVDKTFNITQNGTTVYNSFNSEELRDLVPTLTMDNQYGYQLEFYSNNGQKYGTAYQAFYPNTGYVGYKVNSTGKQYLYIKFPNPVRIYRITYSFNGSMNNFYIQGSNNETNYATIYHGSNVAVSGYRDYVCNMSYIGNYIKMRFMWDTVQYKGCDFKNIRILGILNEGDYELYKQITVITNVPNGTETKTITQNGTYTPTAPNIGFSEVSVNVPTETKTITQNGTYTPTAPNIGFSEVVVNVQEIVINNYSYPTITSNGLYSIPSGYTGLNDVTVSVQPNNYSGYDVNNPLELYSTGGVINIPSGYTGLGDIYYTVISVAELIVIGNSSSGSNVNLVNGSWTDKNIILDLNNRTDLSYALHRVNGTNAIYENIVEYKNVSLNITTVRAMFANCNSLKSVPLFNTSNVIYMNSFFYECNSLTSVPLFNTSNVNNMRKTFTGCNSLSNESLNNILRMCINSEVTDKRLNSYVEVSSNYNSTIMTLSNYNDFIAAGWSLS